MTALLDLSPCQLGVTGYCKHGHHNRCPYRPGGALPNGMVVNECTVTFPATRKSGGEAYPAHFQDGRIAHVVEPHHVYRCPCTCHEAGQPGQMELFTTEGLEVMA